MEPYQELEQRWARWNNLDPAGMVVCSSGTAALHLALEAMQLPVGSKVIVPDFTMIACARAVTLAGLEPVLVDCSKQDLLIDCDLVSRTVCSVPRVRAIMPVHIYGRRCDMGRVTHIARSYGGLFVIEDLAEAHGVLPHPGSDAACWSFYKNKIIHGEEGGAVWFRSAEKAQHARSLRSLGFTEDHDFTHVPRGHNYRMSNTHASLILDCLEQFPSRTVADRFRRKHEECMDAVLPKHWTLGKRDAVWVYDVCLPSMAAQVVAELREMDIPARHAFKPVSSQEEYAKSMTLGGVAAIWASQSVMYLPLGLDLQQSEGWAVMLKNVAFGLDVSLAISTGESSTYSPC